MELFYSQILENIWGKNPGTMRKIPVILLYIAIGRLDH